MTEDEALQMLEDAATIARLDQSGSTVACNRQRIREAYRRWERVVEDLERGR